MRLLDYSWGLVTSIGRRDFDSLKLILDENLSKPVLSSDSKGMVLKVPVPKQDAKGFYTLHGLYFDPDEKSWAGMWKLYRASVYHGALHAAYSRFAEYAKWAKGKDLTAATYVVSLIEDYRVTKKGATEWPGILLDIAYANYTSALRVGRVDQIAGSERFATKLLLDLWGVSHDAKSDQDEDSEVRSLASQIRVAVDESVNGKKDYPDALFAAADGVYSKFAKAGRLREVPSFPYTEAHRDCTIFNGQVVEVEDPASLEESALGALGLKLSSVAPDDPEAKESFSSMREAEAKLAKTKQDYEKFIAATRLEGVEYPRGDYANFLRIRSSLSGPIRTIRDQLRMVNNVLDDTPRHESGQLDTQAAMQVVASGEMRSDVFLRVEPTSKNEAWAILIDASKSTSSFAHEVRSITTCLAEVAKELIPARNHWGMFSFNSTFQIIKDFSEGYGSETKARIGGIEQRHMTLLPDAITVAHKALSAQPVETRILVVASDGYPTGYRDIDKALVSTVKQVSNSGTLLMGLGIDSHAIEDYFLVNCVVNSPAQMMKSFVKSYLELASLF